MQYYTLAQFRKKANLSVEEANRIVQYIESKNTTDCIECNGEVYVSYNFAEAFIKNHTSDAKSNSELIIPGVIKGIAGAFLLSLVGVPIQFILVKIGRVSAAAGLFPYICANIGYVWITKGDINAEKWRTVCCILISLIMVSVNSVLAYALVLMQELAKNGLNVSFLQSVDYLLHFPALSELRDSLIDHIVLSYTIWGICVGVSYFRNKRK